MTFGSDSKTRAWTTAPKTAFASLTNWGGLIAILAGLYDFVINNHAAVEALLGSDGAAILGGIIAIIGRFRARQPVTVSGSA
jgi:hypothetical protein